MPDSTIVSPAEARVPPVTTVPRAAPDLSSLTFGVELECYLPEGITFSTAAAAAQHRIGKPVMVESYNHLLRPHWKVTTDGSLGDYTRGIELVSPPLGGAAGLTEATEVCRALTDLGCTVNKKCGLHIHVGISAAQPLGFFKNLVRLYHCYEPVIDSMMPPSRRGSANQYCKTLAACDHAALANAQNIDAVINAMSPQRGDAVRFVKLNIAAYRRHRTVEFRQHSGTLDSAKTARWITLCLHMVAAALRPDFPLANGIPGTTAPGGGNGGTVVTNRARPGSKAYQVGQLLLRPEGVTAREVCAALGWPSVSLPQQAGICRIPFTTQRMGREVRYFAVTTPGASAAADPTVAAAPLDLSLDGFADLIRLPDDDREYCRRRITDLGGSVQWSA